jgi:hypothetical protein
MITNPQKRAFVLITLFASTILATPCFAARGKVEMSLPDFTKGDPIPAGANHDWNLGATGARGWMFCEKMVTTDARQISVTKVDPDSPADGVLAVGDVILGVGGKPFSYDPRTEFGKALTTAEAGKGELSLIRWRGGKEEAVTLGLPALGSYSATAPYDCEKSKKIREQGFEALAKKMASPDYRQNNIPRCINALALLASGDPKYLPLVKKEVEWASNFTTDAMATWYYGYVMMLVSEYTMATGDKSYLPGLQRIAMEAAKGQSIVGSWGHKFAGPDGRLVGYGMMNSPGITLTTSLVLARAAGVNDPEISAAIERSAKLLRFYAGKGSVPYGDHNPWMQTHEDNGKNGMAAVLFSLTGETDKAEYFSRMSLASHGNERDQGHTGNFFNITWSIPAVAQSGPAATGAWMEEFGAWYFDLARRWDGTFVHLGPPQPANDSYASWDCTGAYLLAYAKPLKNIYLTGKKTSTVPQLDSASAKSIVRDGRGWDNKDRNSAYDALSGDELFERLGSWSPIVRDRAAMALGRKGDVPVDALVKMLGSPKLEVRYGACTTLGYLKEAAAPAVPALRKCLKDKDLWLRIEAAEALAGIGEPAMVALPDLLTMLAKDPTKEDPRGMEQRYLSVVVFGNILKRTPLDGVDPDLLRTAITAGLKNQDGRSRGAIGGIYDKFTYEETRPLLPAIHDAIVTGAPSGIMFADEVRLSGLSFFAKHHIKEGMPLCIELMEPGRWGQGRRIPRCISILKGYGAAAKPMLPKLKEMEQEILKRSNPKKPDPLVEVFAAAIKEIETSTKTVELRSIR